MGNEETEKLIRYLLECRSQNLVRYFWHFFAMYLMQHLRKIEDKKKIKIGPFLDFRFQLSNIL